MCNLAVGEVIPIPTLLPVIVKISTVSPNLRALPPGLSDFINPLNTDWYA